MWTSHKVPFSINFLPSSAALKNFTFYTSASARDSVFSTSVLAAHWVSLWVYKDNALGDEMQARDGDRYSLRTLSAAI